MQGIFSQYTGAVEFPVLVGLGLLMALGALVSLVLVGNLVKTLVRWNHDRLMRATFQHLRYRHFTEGDYVKLNALKRKFDELEKALQESNLNQKKSSPPKEEVIPSIDPGLVTAVNNVCDHTRETMGERKQTPKKSLSFRRHPGTQYSSAMGIDAAIFDIDARIHDLEDSGDMWGSVLQERLDNHSGLMKDLQEKCDRLEVCLSEIHCLPFMANKKNLLPTYWGSIAKCSPEKADSFKYRGSMASWAGNDLNNRVVMLGGLEATIEDLSSGDVFTTIPKGGSKGVSYMVHDVISGSCDETVKVLAFRVQNPITAKDRTKESVVVWERSCLANRVTCEDGSSCEVRHLIPGNAFCSNDITGQIPRVYRCKSVNASTPGGPVDKVVAWEL